MDLRVDTCLHHHFHCADMSATDGKATTITLPQRGRERLRDYPVGGKSAAEAIEDLMVEVPPDDFRRDIHRALLRPRHSLDEFRRRLRLPRPG